MPGRAPLLRRFLTRHRCDHSLPTEIIGFVFHLDTGDYHCRVEVRRDEDGTWWGHVPDLPGCFATGTSLSDLFTSTRRSVESYLTSVP